MVKLGTRSKSEKLPSTANPKRKRSRAASLRSALSSTFNGYVMADSECPSFLHSHERCQKIAEHEKEHDTCVGGLQPGHVGFVQHEKLLCQRPIPPSLEDFDRLMREMEAREEVLIVIGDTLGLEQELALDISTFCLARGVPKRDVSDLLNRVNKALENEYTFEHSALEITITADVTPEHSLTVHVLLCPKSHEFHATLSRICRGSVAQTFRVLFCGHGSDDGTIVLADGDYHSSQLQQLFEDDVFLHWPRIAFVFNCCYALHFVAGLMLDLPSEDETERVDHAMKQLDDYAGSISTKLRGLAAKVRFSEQPLSEENIANNDTLFDAILDRLGDDLVGGPGGEDLVDRGTRSPLSTEWGDNRVYLWPLSLGPLQPKGALLTYLNHQNADFADGHAFSGLIDPSRFRGRPKYYELSDASKFRLYMPVPSARPKLANFARPTVVSFQAEHGDSTMLRFKKWNLLFDGGLSGNPPCFWSYLATQVGVVDSVFVTHGDSDHVGGLLPLFARKKHEVKGGVLAGDVKKSPLVKKVVLLADDGGTAEKQTRASRSWKHNNMLFEYAKQANIETEVMAEQGWMLWQDSNANGTVGMEVYCVLPTEKDRLSAMKELQKQPASRGVSPINRWGIVFHALCWDNDQRWDLLFTGDAMGDGIVKNGTFDDLEIATDYFDFVDMPHHGSEKNKPEGFLPKLDTKNVLVSTDGGTYGHPDQRTVDTLKQYLKTHKHAKLHFNHKEFAAPGKVTDKSPARIVKQFKAFKNQVNFNSKSHFLIEL